MHNYFHREKKRLNAICPYFTMFPLDFPLDILKKWAQPGEYVLDPFCGRGTTNFAARLLGLHSLGVDSNPVAIAITAAKLVSPSVEEILDEAQRILHERQPKHIPKGEFWEWAFYPSVLEDLCRFREAFLEECSSEAQIALRGILLGALHGPKQKISPGYLSNQFPRTYAPKPAYALRFWKKHNLTPEPIDIMALIERRAKRYYGIPLPKVHLALVRLADSRDPESLRPVSPEKSYHWIITSPPYYGMRTYIPDQWLRYWFLGGPDQITYNQGVQIAQSRINDFIADLRKVWQNVWLWSAEKARMVIRFGSIPSRSTNPIEIIQNSLRDTGWKITEIKRGGTASNGRRQADAFLSCGGEAAQEYDIWVIKGY